MKIGDRTHDYAIVSIATEPLVQADVVKRNLI